MRIFEYLRETLIQLILLLGLCELISYRNMITGRIITSSKWKDEKLLLENRMRVSISDEIWTHKQIDNISHKIKNILNDEAGSCVCLRLTKTPQISIYKK